MKKNRFSIIIPAYNCENTINKCVNSILGQLGNEDEIIIVDDFSTDNTYNIIKELSNENRIKTVKNTSNKGVSYSRNLGVELAKNNLIMFIDSDDYIDKDSLMDYIKIYKARKPDLICSGIVRINTSNNKKKIINFNMTKELTNREDISLNVLELEKKDLFSSACNKLYIKDIISNNNLKFSHEANNMEDFEFNCKYINYCKKVYILNKAKYFYTYTKNISLSSSYISNLLERYYLIKELRRQLYETILSNDKVEKHMLNMNSNYLLKCINNLYRENSYLDKEERCTTIQRIINLNDLKTYIDMTDYRDDNYTKIMKMILKQKNVKIIDKSFIAIKTFRRLFKNIYSYLLDILIR